MILFTGLGSVDAFQLAEWFRPATTSTLTASASQVPVGGANTFTVAVREYNGNIPIGSVAIEDLGASTYLSTSKLDSSGTVLITIELSAGPHSIVAQYLNDGSAAVDRARDS
jgi:hypothetical protein